MQIEPQKKHARNPPSTFRKTYLIFKKHDKKICLDPQGHKPPSFGQPSSLHLVLTEIKSKIENTGICSLCLKTDPVWIIIIIVTDTAVETIKTVIHVSLVGKSKSVLKHHVHFLMLYGRTS